MSTAIRSGLIAVGVTPVPAHYLGMRKVVYDACFKKEARGYRMHDERAGRTLVEALCQDKKTLHDLATRTTMTGRRGWAGTTGDHDRKAHQGAKGEIPQRQG